MKCLNIFSLCFKSLENEQFNLYTCIVKVGAIVLNYHEKIMHAN